MPYYRYRLVRNNNPKGQMQMTLTDIRKQLLPLMGKRIRLRALGERNRVHITGGILDGLYPKVFTVLIQEEGRSFHCSFSYRDILMGRLDIKLAAAVLEYA